MWWIGTCRPRYVPAMAQWRIELGAEDVAALSRGEEITVTAVDDELEMSEDSLEVAVVMREY